MYQFLLKKGIIVVALLCVASASFWFLWESTEKETDSNATSAQASLETHVDDILEHCRDRSYRPVCYEEEVPKLLALMPVEEVFTAIRMLRAHDPEYQLCHVLAHKLGELEVAKDPQNWIDVIARGPTDGLCSNGFGHGAAVARFRSEVLSEEAIRAAVPELSIACEVRDNWRATPLDQAICYHGVGHVLLHLTGANIEQSLEVCEEIGLKDDGRDFRQLCDEGVFMQIFQKIEPEDFALVERLPMQPTKENLAEFCAQYGDEVDQSTCWREGWILYQEELKTAEGILDFCGRVIDETQTRKCFDTVLSITGRTGLNDSHLTTEICKALPTQLQQDCFNRSAMAYLEEDKTMATQAVNFCGESNEVSIRNGCYQMLIDRSDFLFGSYTTYAIGLCNAMPEAWQERCRMQTL